MVVINELILLLLQKIDMVGLGDAHNAIEGEILKSD
jgi:hypothetical protein